MSEDSYKYEHLVDKCGFKKNERKVYFDIIEKLFAITGDMDEFHEKNTFNSETKKISNVVCELSETIKLELGRELERQGLSIVYEKEILDITRNDNGEIVS